MAWSTKERPTEVLVIGSGAGGAIIAATLSEAGHEVLIVEEGPEVDAETIGTNTPRAMQMLYRNAGLTPILGRSSIAFVEGCCVGGSTEINSSFWHHPPASAIKRWVEEYKVSGLSSESLEGLLEELEETLRPTYSPNGQLPASSRVFARGLERLGLPAMETPRLQCGDPTRSQFGPGAKSSMSRTYLPRAVAAGATLIPNCRVDRIVHRAGRVKFVEARLSKHDKVEKLRIRARFVFVCGGAIQTPALLRRSGIKRLVGDSLRIQPMLKVAATFGEILDAHESVMPVYQMHDPKTGFFLGGSVCTPGFLGMSLSERWPENAEALRDWRRMGIFYTACRGTSRGKIRVFPGTGEAIVSYAISREDRYNLSMGMAKLSEALFTAGAEKVYPAIRDCAPLCSPYDVLALVAEGGPKGISPQLMSISTVHASSSCPMGENKALCPVDSAGRVRGFDNLWLGDASIIPDAPGVNPQGTVMALAFRNARLFLAEQSAST